MTMTRRTFLSAIRRLGERSRLAGRAGAAPLPREADIVVIGAGRGRHCCGAAPSWRQTAR